ncbi:hypothetical protein [Kineococcus rubinsiae]|uniref:hypothetical protein n=1 Tax=Kineococcus rubinsiae TaxID=2609562 RepID=UPI0027E4D444|nr:hypothetical protein [Kineococcus rubinsiae]
MSERGLNSERTQRPARRTTGLGRALVALYAVFAVAAVSRAAVQIATDFDAAPLAYVLSAFSGVVYVLATLGLARTGARWRRVAWAACSVELLGVLVVGTLSLADAQAFPDSTVWSGYGSGYGYVPLVLPVLGLVYLRRESRRRS